MKTAELTGALLDGWVVRALMEPFKGRALNDQTKADIIQAFGPGADVPFQPSTNWAHGGPIIEREKMTVEPFGEGWGAGIGEIYTKWYVDGPTLLVAAMRAYVASKFGEEVPDAAL